MLKKNEGYFLADMVLSLTAILMSAAFLLPSFIHLKGQLVQTRQDAGAVHILYDELLHIRTLGKSSGRAEIVRDNISYELTVTEDESQKPTEVCVRYGGENYKETNKCAFVE